MLFYSLTLATILLILANYSARRGGGATAGFLICGFCFTCGGGILYPVGILYCLLLVLHPFTKRAVLRRKYFLKYSLVSALVVFALASGYALVTLNEYDELRRDYPLESMDERLPPIQPSVPLMLSDLSVTRLNALESKIDSQKGRSYWRNYQLELLHDTQVNLFVQSSGFGIMRMPSRPSRQRLEHSNNTDSLPQPIDQETFGEPVEMEQWMPQQASVQQYSLHDSGTLDFLNIIGFGYFKDRQHVAGFQPHRFSAVPNPADQRKVQTIDLVSLLLHENAVAYVSDELPSMDRLRKAPIRPLNEFETSGLAKLRTGEYLVVESTSSKMRMLGSIRSTKQCLECHGGQRGDLLGAFSYILK